MAFTLYILIFLFRYFFIYIQTTCYITYLFTYGITYIFTYRKNSVGKIYLTVNQLINIINKKKKRIIVVNPFFFLNIAVSLIKKKTDYEKI